MKSHQNLRNEEIKEDRYPYNYENEDCDNSYNSEMDDLDEDNSCDDNLSEDNNLVYKQHIMNSHLYKRGPTKY